MFVADDLAAWLIGLLADAGRKKLTSLVLGTDQERALRQATTSAVQHTADELRPGDDEQAEHLALVISQVFSEPVPSPTAVQATLLEALQGGINRQLAVLDDATLTGTGQSSADMLGVAGMVVAQKLTGHLVQEIVARGSRGGPLAPLADQLNHDVTHLQGQRLEGMLGQLAGEVRRALARLGGSPAVTAGEESARPGNTISGGTFFGPVLQGRDVRATLSAETARGVRGQEVAGHVFISHVREDSDRVDHLQSTLQEAGIPVWRDTADLWPGEDWRSKIRDAITSSALVFLACFSKSSLARTRSYQSEELVLAIEQLRQRPPERPWLIPVRFDDCEIPDRDIGGGRTLTSIQRVDLFGDRADEGARRLIVAILRILGRDSDPARAETRPAPQEEAQSPTEPASDGQGSRRQAGPNHPADTGMPARTLQPRPAFTGRWLQTADGFAASPLMNMVNTSMPGYAGTQEPVPFVRIGACVATDSIPPDASSGHMGDRFIALLNRDPVAGFISRLTYVDRKVAWVRHAGNGILRLDAVMSSGNEHERPTASAMLLTPVTGMRNYGRADGIACLWLHVEPRAQEGSPRAFNLPQWHGHLCRAVDTAAALAGYLSEDLGLQTRDDPSARVGVLLQVPAAMSDLVDTGHLTPLPGAVRSTQFLGYVIASPAGKPADEAVLDLLRQLCDHTLHLGGGFERTLEAIPRSSRLTPMPGT